MKFAFITTTISVLIILIAILWSIKDYENSMKICQKNNSETVCQNALR